MIRDFVDRVDLDDFADRVLDSFWARPELQEARPPRRLMQEWVRWNLDMVLRWLSEGVPPSEAELDVFRARARARAQDGTPVDFVPGNFRRGARFGWNAALERANERERAALVESADLLFEFVDRVSRIYAEAYESAARSAPVEEDERRARALLRRLCADEPPTAEEVQLAVDLGFESAGAFHPFVIALPGPPGERHLALAQRLRRMGTLAIAEGRWTTGLADAPLDLTAIGLPSTALVAEGRLTGQEEIGRALEELRMLTSISRSHGDHGRLQLSDHLPEMLLRSSPSIAARIRTSVYGPLRPYSELSRTLDVLIEHDFNRQQAAAALPVHRNTLRARLLRISELSGLDLDAADDRGLAWLAHLCAPSDSPAGA